MEYPLPSGARRRVLYDLERDPRETTDVSQQHPEVAARLGSELDRWTAELDAVARREPESQRSDDTLERLRALGYIQ